MQEKVNTGFSSAVESLRDRSDSLSDKVKGSVGLLIQDVQQRVEQEPVETEVLAVKFIESMKNTDTIEKFSSFYASSSDENKKKILDDLVGSEREERMFGPLATFLLKNREGISDDNNDSALIMQKSPSKLQH